MDAPYLEKSRLRRAESLKSFELDDEDRGGAAENYGGKDMTKTPIHQGHRRGGAGGVRRSNSNSINRKPPQRESESVTDTEAYCTPMQRQRRSVKMPRSRSARNLSLMPKTPRASSPPSSREHGLAGMPRSRSDRNLSLMQQKSPKSSPLEHRLEAGRKSAAAADNTGDGDAREVKSVMSLQRQRRHHRPHLSSKDASSRRSFRVRNNNNDSADKSVSTVRTDVEHSRRREGSRRDEANGGRPSRPRPPNARPRHRPEGSGSSRRGRGPVGTNENEDHGRSGRTRAGDRQHRPSSPDRATSNNQQHERPRNRRRERRSREEQTSNERPRRSLSRERRSREERQNQKLDNAPKSPSRKASVDHQRIPTKSPRRPDLQNEESSDKPRRTQHSSPRRCFRSRVAPNSSPKTRTTPTSEKSSPCSPSTEHILIPSLDHVQCSEESSPKSRAKSNLTELSSSSSDKEGSNNSYDVDDDATDDGTVLQFDPTQANNVYRVQQVSNAGSSCEVKNSDGTCSTVQIAEIVDRAAAEAGVLTNEESPIFDFLEDQDVCPPHTGVQAPRLPTRRSSAEPPPSPHRAAFEKAQEEEEEKEVERIPQPEPQQQQQRGDCRSQSKTHAGPRNSDQSGSGIRKKRPSGPDRQPSTADESQEFTSHNASSGKRRPAPPLKTGSEHSATRKGPQHAAMKISTDNGETTEKQTDAAVPKINSSRRIVGDAQNYSQFFSSVPRSPGAGSVYSGRFNDSFTSLGTDGYSVGYSVGADGVSAMNPPSLTEDERDSPPARPRPRLKSKKKKPQHGPHGTPVVRKPRTFATRDNNERSPNSESEFSDARSVRERRMRVKQPPIIPPVENGGSGEGGRQTTVTEENTGANNRDPFADEPQTP